MNILSIDSSTNKVSIALKKHDDVFSLESKQEIHASQVILSMIDEILKKYDMKCKDLNALTFNKGPASFTGTRIAASVTQAIGYSWQIPVFGISSLVLMAFDYYEKTNHSEILCIKKAYSQKIFWALYDIKKNLYVPINGNHISSFSDVKLNTKHKWHGISNCWDEYQAGSNKSIDQSVKCINIQENISAKKIIDFAIANENFEKKFNYKDTLPEYVSHDLFD